VNFVLFLSTAATSTETTRGDTRQRRRVKQLTRKLVQLKREWQRCLGTRVAVAGPAIANDPDPLNSGDVPGIGAVPYDYSIGKYEVTLDQYAAFLNAVAADDTYTLYNGNLEITQSGSEGNFTYAPSASGNPPVNYVSWFDAARFCNWLHNGMPAGAQDTGTTEDGAYALNGATSGVEFVREATAKYWIPSENEWYKAAYHDPRDEADGGPPGDDHFWEYPTMSDTPPTAEAPPGIPGTNSANYGGSNVGGYTDGGEYVNSPSYYGTFDQGGNLWEWNDAVIGDSFRGVRGGSWGNGGNELRSSNRFVGFPVGESGLGGFRVASP
jgi:formylglycine-generating enzyme required for sulfatase activity